MFYGHDNIWRDNNDVKEVLLTLSEKGIFSRDTQMWEWKIPAHELEVQNHTTWNVFHVHISASLVRSLLQLCHVHFAYRPIFRGKSHVSHECLSRALGRQRKSLSRRHLEFRIVYCRPKQKFIAQSYWVAKKMTCFGDGFVQKYQIQGCMNLWLVVSGSRPHCYR